MTRLTKDQASRFARLTLSHLERRYPYKMDLVMEGPGDAREPEAHHPIFHGSFDWHSCVHGWWQVLRLVRLFPDMPEATEIRSRADRMLVPEKAAGELAFLDRPSSRGFERPYGWAWLLALHAELQKHDADWADNLAMLADAFALRFHDFLPRLTYPVRAGTHGSTAFALILAQHWADRSDPALNILIRECALHWFVKDENCQCWEPGGDDFLSPALTQAQLLSRILPRRDFAEWFGRFLPDLSSARPETLFLPARVSDRTDGKIVHLDGLNLSRAWAWRDIAAALGKEHPIAATAERTAQLHIEASLPHLDDDYMGSHWLATFALLALDGLDRAEDKP